MINFMAMPRKKCTTRLRGKEVRSQETKQDLTKETRLVWQLVSVIVTLLHVRKIALYFSINRTTLFYLILLEIIVNIKK